MNGGTDGKVEVPRYLLTAIALLCQANCDKLGSTDDFSTMHNVEVDVKSRPIKNEVQGGSNSKKKSAKRRKKILLIPQMGRRPIAKSVVFFEIGDGDHEIMTLKI